MNQTQTNTNTRKVLAIIPARAGSKRLPGKNKKILAGKALIQYAIEAALGAQTISTIVVNSDDPDILAIAGSYPRVIAIERPAAISGDTALAITYVQHTLDYLAKHKAKLFDAVAIIQPSSPFTLSEDIDHTVQLLLDHSVDSAVSVVKLDHAIHPAKLKVLSGAALLPYLEEENGRMAAHELPELYVRNCSVYVSTIETIERNEIIGPNCLGYVMPRERSLDINDPVDFEFAAFLKEKANGSLAV